MRTTLTKLLQTNCGHQSNRGVNVLRHVKTADWTYLAKLGWWSDISLFGDHYQRPTCELIGLRRIGYHQFWYLLKRHVLQMESIVQKSGRVLRIEPYEPLQTEVITFLTDRGYLALPERPYILYYPFSLTWVPDSSLRDPVQPKAKRILT